MNELTDQEIENFMKFLQKKLPLLEFALERERLIMTGLRTCEMNDEILSNLEKSTERVCRFYNIAETWKGILERGFPYDKRGSKATCSYVRLLNQLMFKEGELF